MEFTKVKTDAFSTLQMNAGVILSEFDPTTGSVVDANILGATTGGLSFSANPTYMDFGEDVDNCPPNTKQLKVLQYVDPQISGTFISLNADVAASLAGGGTVTAASGKITPPPRGFIADDAFQDIWLVGDYSDKNTTGTGTTAGFVAVHIMDGLNTVGVQWQTTKDGKGQFAFEYHGHYDLENIDVVPFEMYVKAGT